MFGSNIALLLPYVGPRVIKTPVSVNHKDSLQFVRNAGAVLLSLLIWVAGLIYFISGAVLLLLVALFWRGRFFEHGVKLFCRGLLACAGIRLSVSGRENIQPGKQYILVMNHVNIFDGFLLYAGFPGHMCGVEEESHFHWPIYGWIVRRVGNIPISRTSGSRAVHALQDAAALIRSRSDFSFTVMPEGTRTRDGRLGPFKRGAFLLALEAGLDILPIVQKGAYRINRRGSKLIRPGRLEVVFEKPLATSGYNRETVGQLMADVRAVFLHHLQE